MSRALEKPSGGYVLDGRKEAFRGRREACRGTVPSSFLNSSFAFLERLLKYMHINSIIDCSERFHTRQTYAMIDLSDVIWSVIFTAVTFMISLPPLYIIIYPIFICIYITRAPSPPPATIAEVAPPRQCQAWVYAAMKHAERIVRSRPCE